MKILLIIGILLTVTFATAQVTYEYEGVTYEEANTLEEVKYDHHAIPINCPANKYRKMKKQKEKERRKYNGTRWVDRTGDAVASLGRGIGRVAVYVATGLVVTVIVGIILDKAQDSY